MPRVHTRDQYSDNDRLISLVEPCGSLEFHSASCVLLVFGLISGDMHS